MPSTLESVETAAMNCGTVLDAVMAAGDATKQQLGEQFEQQSDPLGNYSALWIVLNHLVCADLLNMRVTDGAWHYRPTAKARRERAAAKQK
jgi:hypothetical protein